MCSETTSNNIYMVQKQIPYAFCKQGHEQIHPYAAKTNFTCEVPKQKHKKSIHIIRK